MTSLAALHAAHDLSHGYALWISLFTGAMVVAQCAVLEGVCTLASRGSASRWTLWAGGALVSAGFGVLIVVPHSGPWHFSRAFVASGSVVVGFAVAGLWLLVFQLPAFVDRAHGRALEVESLRREAELARLRFHLQPHFLLNTLNAIAGLVTEEPAEARRLLAALGDLVRDATLAGDELQPFRIEAAWLRRYAEILEARYRGVLRFRWQLAEETLEVRTPRLLLQPLVENAVKHGALRARGGGWVRIASEPLGGGGVRFAVEDDGPGLGPDPGHGMGIDLVRRRLALLCPGACLHLEPLAAGTCAVVEIPSPEGSA